jgi:predicted aldo/keto reductase-like oxidoreductase
VRRTPAEWALQWVWNHAQASMLLSGMSTMQQIIENIASADRSDADSLSDAELTLIDKVREEFRRLAPVPCTKCRYCLPCPNGVEITEILEVYNDAIIYDNSRAPRFHYSNLPKEKQADNCVECFECEEKCPQGIPITEYLKTAHAYLTQKN